MNIIAITIPLALTKHADKYMSIYTQTHTPDVLAYPDASTSLQRHSKKLPRQFVRNIFCSNEPFTILQIIVFD